MPKVIFFDSESDATFKMLGGGRGFGIAHMQATVVCALVVESKHCACAGKEDDVVKHGEKLHWWRDEGASSAPFAELLDLFDESEMIVAYNGLGFDFPLLGKYYGRGHAGRRRYCSHRFKCHDPFARLRAATDTWPKLDVLLKANGLAEKTGDGVLAVKLWAEGRRDELLKYCERDVEQLARLCMLDKLKVPDIGEIPPAVFGASAALASMRELTLPSAADKSENEGASGAGEAV